MKQIEKIIKASIKYSDSKGDQKDFYNLVAYAAKTPKIADQPPFLEIGTRRGGSALALLKVIEALYPDTVLVTVDPYGNKPYDSKPWKYGDDFYVEMKNLLASYENHIHYHMTSEDFLDILDQVHYWSQRKEHDFSRFSFIFLDGSHLPENILFEFENLLPLLIKGGYLVIDNTDFYEKKIQKHFSSAKNPHLEVTNTKNQTIIKKWCKPTKQTE